MAVLLFYPLYSSAGFRHAATLQILTRKNLGRRQVNVVWQNMSPRVVQYYSKELSNSEKSQEESDKSSTFLQMHKFQHPDICNCLNSALSHCFFKSYTKQSTLY